MAADFNFTQEDLMKIVQTWYDKKVEGDYSIAILFRLSTLYSNGVQRIFMGYGQPPLVLFYVSLITFLTYVLVKENMLGFINVLLIISNIIEIIPSLVLMPINIVFYHLANVEAPMPYPWCYLHTTLDDSASLLVHAVTINLKILLAFNRFYSIYFPFKYSTAFTTKRCAIYIISVISVGALVSALLNFTFEKVTKQQHFDDVWGDGRYDWYEACSLKPSFLQREIGNHALVATKIIQVSINLICIICLVVFDIFLILKLRKQRRQRSALAEGRSEVIKATDKKIDLLNRVSVWVIWVLIISELPQMLVKIYGLYVLVVVGTEDNTEVDVSGNSVMSSIAILISAVLMPMDMIVLRS